MLAYPKSLKPEMAAYRAGVACIPAGFIKYHERLARADIEGRKAWTVYHAEMVRDGWCDGFKVLQIVARVSGELVDLQWHESGAWFQRTSGGGWSRAYEMLASTGSLVDSILAADKAPSPERKLITHLTGREGRALRVIADIGLEVIGGSQPSDILEDNMTWFDQFDIAKELKISGHAALETMKDLEAKGLVADSGERPNNEKGPSHWYLTDLGVEIAQEIYEVERL